MFRQQWYSVDHSNKARRGKLMILITFRPFSQQMELRKYYQDHSLSQSITSHFFKFLMQSWVVKLLWLICSWHSPKQIATLKAKWGKILKGHFSRWDLIVFCWSRAIRVTPISSSSLEYLQKMRWQRSPLAANERTEASSPLLTSSRVMFLPTYYKMHLGS